MIKLVRIDHRLLHGQVLFAWTKSEGIERIIVIDNSAAEDDLRKMTMKLSKPADVKLSVFSVEQAKERMDKINAVKENTMVIFGNVTEMSMVVPQLKDVKEVNYGGVPDRPGAKRYSNTIFLTPEEVEQSRKVKDAGFQLYMQQVPTSKRDNLNNML